MLFAGTINKIPYGGDYNPEQWPEAIWQEDMRLLPKAGIDTVTLNVFNWAQLQPAEDTYDFTALDKVVDTVTKAGMNIIMATGTAAHPAWMARKYPDILRVTADGQKRKFGGRQNSCPNSPTYQKYSVRLATKLAQRYGTLKNLAAWHVSNEYYDTCYCENCEKAFRVWLRAKYGAIAALNEAWNTAFWGHTYYDWEDIVAPSHISETWEPMRTTMQNQALDYKRFNSDALLAAYIAEHDALKAVTPAIPVTTNLMATYRELDYHKWGKHLDFISWDNYPRPETPYTRTAMNHALMRGLKDNAPYCLMEQTPSVTNWAAYCALKRPGIMRLWSYQAVAHGSDTVMFFQMRRSRGCCEKFHGAIIDHAGHENTRVFREAAALGAELTALGDTLLDSRVHSAVAVIFDWDTWWATAYSAGPSADFDYVAEVFAYYDAFVRQNVNVDVIGMDADFSKYKVIVAPVMYMVKPGAADRLKAFTKAGGAFVTTYFSGYVDERDLITTGGYPGELRDLSGVWVEEIDALLPGAANAFVIPDGDLKGEYPATLLCDIMHAETAEVVAVYKSDFYAGAPALCHNKYGSGDTWYIGAKADGTLLGKLAAKITAAQGLTPIMAAPPNVEVTARCKDGAVFVFALNHNAAPVDITVPFAAAELLTGTKVAANSTVTLEAAGVAIFSVIYTNFH